MSEEQNSQPVNLAPAAGSGLPQTFGGKLAYMGPVIALTVVITLLVTFGLVWVVRGGLDEKIEDTRVTLKNTKEEVAKNFEETKVVATEQKKQIETVQQQNAQQKEVLTEIKSKLEQQVVKDEELAGNLGKLEKGLANFTEDQKKVDSSQNQNISDNSTKIVYIEKRLEKLQQIETDVMALKNDTGNLKGQYVQLTKDLTAVKEKGEITEQELTDLTERSRIFQLRVLQARAQEAAEAARKRNLKTLLARIDEIEE